MNENSDVVKMIGSFVTFFAAVFGLLCIGPFVGYAGGWCVSLFFNDSMLMIISQLGLKNVTLPQFGAFLGFVGPFLKTKVST